MRYLPITMAYVKFVAYLSSSYIPAVGNLTI